MRKKWYLAAGLAALSSLQAATINFECITDNGNGCASMVGQLSADVTDPGSDQILFTFNNAGPIASVITQIYWDDDNGLLDSIASITNSPGVDFAAPASPANLPSGSFTAEFSVGATPPPSDNGINPGESLPVLFNLSAGTTFDDVIAALEDGTVLVGMHVQAIGTAGGSDSVVSLPPGEEPPPPPQVIPEPSTYALMGAGLLLLGTIKNRRK